MRDLARGCWLLLLLTLGTGAFAAERPAYRCYQAPVAPVMDGAIAGDPAWKRIPAVTGFSKLGDGFTDAKQTFARACWDAQALYTGVTCEEPDVASLQLKVRDGGPTWEDDGIEVFLQPGEGRPVTQFVVTAGGARGGFEGSPDFLRYQAAAHAGEDFYSLEIRIPFELLEASPTVGDKWLGDVCRNIWATKSGGDKFTCWAPLQTRFLEPEHFATIELLGPPPEAAGVTALEDRLNRRYRADLTRRLGVSAARGKEYVPVLTEASERQQYRVKALELLRRWGELEQLQQAAKSAPLPELRRVIKGADALVEESYNLKYAYLIATVLGD
jgi:hypothetical protein